MSKVELDVSDETLKLQVVGLYDLCLPFSRLCISNSTTAKFSKKNQSLTVNVPVRS
jgi:hypothetical protein